MDVACESTPLHDQNKMNGISIMDGFHSSYNGHDNICYQDTVHFALTVWYFSYWNYDSRFSDGLRSITPVTKSVCMISFLKNASLSLKYYEEQGIYRSKKVLNI